MREFSKAIRTKQTQREMAVWRTYHAYYFYNRPTWEIERQARGELAELHIPERAQLAQFLYSQPDDLSDEELAEICIESGELMTGLCLKREMPKQVRIRQRPQAGALAKDEPLGRDPFPLFMQKMQCPRCVGDQRQSYGERMLLSCRTAVMNDHFDREHLMVMKEMEQDNLIFCDYPKCKEEGVKLKHLDHLRNHVHAGHGI